MLDSSTLRIDQCVPAEVWKHIFSYLYPSQLCRLSRVNHTFNAIVSSLPIWYHLFTKFNYRKRLRLLSGKTASKCYMLYVCANSLHICEQCYWHVKSSCMYHFPLPVLEPLPKSYSSEKEVDKLCMDPYKSVYDYRSFVNNLRDHIPSIHGDDTLDFMEDDGNMFSELDQFQTVGAPINLSWTVRKCLGCRRKRELEQLPEEIMDRLPRPSLTRTLIMTKWCEIFPGYRFASITDNNYLHSLLPITEEFVLSELEKHYGGAVGVEVSMESSKAYYEKTKARIQWYRNLD